MKTNKLPIVPFLTGFTVMVILGAMFAPPPVRAMAGSLVSLCFGSGLGSGPVARYGLGTGKATFGLALPQGAVTDAVKVGTFLTQTDVKKRWADGSIRFAIVSANVTNGGTFDITPDTAVPGSFNPSWPQASVEFAMGGQTYVATLPAFSQADQWLAGPVVRESRVIVSPSVPGGAAHPLLRVIFDVRSYAAGGHRVDVAVDTVKDQAGAGLLAYDVTIRVGGAVAYSHNGLQHAYLTRWRKTFTTGGLSESTVTTDFQPFYNSGFLPRFLQSVGNGNMPNTTDPKYDILDFGDLTRYMGLAGGRPEIAPLPYWTAQFLVHQTPQQKNYMLKHADLSGSWSGHIANPDGSQIKITDRPNYWLDGRKSGNDGPVSSGGGLINGTTDMLEVAHIPSLNFVPYLVTGDRWHLDQMTYWASFAVLWTWPYDPRYPRTGGLLGQNQIRGIGWGLRLIAEAAVSQPDGDSLGSYFGAIAQTNLNWLDNYAKNTVPNSALTDIMFWDKSGISNVAAVSMWQITYITYAIYHAEQLGFSTNNAFIDRAARFQVRLFNATGEGLPPTHAAPYYLKVGTWTTWPNFSLYNSMAEAYNATYNNGTLAPTQFAGYLGPECAILLKLGVKRGIPNASQALTYLLNQSGVQSDINGRSGFALVVN